MKLRKIVLPLCILASIVTLQGTLAVEEAQLVQKESLKLPVHIQAADVSETQPEMILEEESIEYETFEEELEEIEILPSKYQSTQGYEWQDLYVILMLLTKTSQHLEGGTPVFSLVSVNERFEPLFIIGSRDQADGGQYYKMYATDNGRVYELLETTQEIWWDNQKEAFYLSEDQAWIRYSPHVLLKEEAEEVPQTAKPLQQISLFKESVTSETIRSFLVDLETVVTE